MSAANKLDQSLMTLNLSDLNGFYTEYYQVLDSLNLEEWPSFFDENCLYKLTGRENFERGLKLGAMMAESRGMLNDRVMALRRTQEYAPRYYRRFPGPIKITNQSEEKIDAEHNLLIVQTLIDKPSDIILCGRCYDSLIIDDGKLLLRKREIVFDSELISNSLIYPA